jgi:hypothetical protein
MSRKLRQIRVQPRRLDKDTVLVVFERNGRRIPWKKEGVLVTHDTHVSRAVRCGDLVLVDNQGAPVLKKSAVLRDPNAKKRG